MRDDRERLLDILEAIQRIEQYADEEKKRFHLKMKIWWKYSQTETYLDQS